MSTSRVIARQPRAQVAVSRTAARIAAMLARSRSSTKKCGAISTTPAQPRVGRRAGIDRGDRGAVGMADQDVAADAGRDPARAAAPARLVVHVGERPGQRLRVGLAIAEAGIGEDAAAGRLGQHGAGSRATGRRSRALRAAARAWARVSARGPHQRRLEERVSAGHVAQAEALDLAGGGLRQRLHELDPARIFPHARTASLTCVLQ